MLIAIPPKYFGGGGDRLPERKAPDPDGPEFGTQAAEFCGPQILGEALTCVRPWGDDGSRLYLESQEMADKRLARLQFEAWSSKS
jgi:hypothetical protein